MSTQRPVPEPAHVLDIHYGGSESIVVMLSGHLSIERLLIAILEDALPRPKAVLRHGRKFSLLIDLVDALGVLEEDLVAVVRGVNRIRNKYAHTFNYEVSFDDAYQLYRRCRGWLEPPEDIYLNDRDSAKREGARWLIATVLEVVFREIVLQSRLDERTHL